MPGLPHTRLFEPRDVAAVAKLFDVYMAELFRHGNAMTPEILLRDGQGRYFHLMLAVDRADAPVGFAAWQTEYDLHNAVYGGHIADFFVTRSHRGQGLAIRLAAAVAGAVAKDGGVFIKGDVLEDDLRRLHLMRRITVGYAAQSVYVGGRGFRELAALVDADLKTLVRKLPSAEASRDP
jgi:GNAT superfamily N-acetyltransferase